MNYCTKKELEAAKGKANFSDDPEIRRDCWGSPIRGLGPAGTIAQLRGAKFTRRYTPTHETTRIATIALEDLAYTLGFANEDDYLDTLGADPYEIEERIAKAWKKLGVL